MAETLEAPRVDTPEDARKIVEWGRANPDLWIEELLNCSMWDIPKRIARSTFHNPRTAVSSCTSSSKSHTAGRVALAFLYLYEPSTVITTAPTFRQVESILWREIKSAWSGAKVNLGGTLKQVSIDIRDDWFAIGLSTDEPERFQGLHNEHVLVIGDEASGLTSNVYTAMENPLAAGRIRRQLLIGNPTQPTGEFKDAFTSPLYKCFHISCFDTPNFTEFGILMDDIRKNTWEAKIEGRPLPRPYLISPQWVWERFEEWGENNILFQIYCLGQFPEAGINTLIPLHLIVQAMEMVKIEAKGERVASLDVSRYGDDETVFGVRQGNKVFAQHTWYHQDTVFTAGRTARLIKEYNPIITRIDAIGVGAGVVDSLLNNGYKVEAFNSSEKALDNEIFGNIRAELYFKLLNMLEASSLQLPDDTKMKSQLADLRYRYNTKNQLFIESKEEARSRGVKSPDRADMLMMLFKPVDAILRSRPKVRNTLG